MGAMGDSGRVGIILLVIAFLAPCVLIAAPVSASIGLTESHGNALGAAQYDPSVLLQPDVCVNDYSWAIGTDPGVVDFDIGDLNGDGLKDIATISDQTNSICIYNRTTNGTLDPIPWRIVLSDVLDMRSIAIGNLDTDGFEDIAVSYVDASGDGRLCILFHSTQFSQSQLPKDISPEPQKTVIGEFDHLGNRSIMTVCMGDPQYSDDYIDIWRYPFGTATKDRYYFPIIASPQFTRSKYLSAGDINGDGYPDIVVGNESGSNVFAALQPSAWKSPWTVSTKSISGAASDVKLADVIGDSRLDLLYANSQNSLIYAYRNTGSGPLYFNSLSETPLQASTIISKIAIGEFSSGAGVDVLALSDSNNASAFMRSSGSSWFTGSSSLTFPVNSNPLKAIVDRSIIDEEGVFVLCHGIVGSSGSIEFFNAQPSLQGNADKNVFLTGKDPTQLANGKLQNGNVVVAATLPGSNQVQMFEKNTSKLSLLTTPSTPLDVAFGNFDDDGNDDLAVLCSGLQVSIFPGYSLMTATQPIKNVTLSMTSPQSILAANLRENGRSDLIVSYDGGCRVIYNSLSSEPFNSTPLIETVGVGVSGLRTAIISADLNNDSHAGDLAILNQGASKVEIYLRNNAGSIPNIYPSTPSSTLSAGGVGLINMTGGDFSGTSDLDIAVTDVNMKVQIFVQPSYGFIIDLSASAASFNMIDKGARIASVDINDDGKEDLLIGYDTIPAIAAFLRDADLSFVNVFNLTCGGNASDIIADDINGDLRDDIACASPVSHALSLWYQNNLEPKANATPSKYSEHEGLSITFAGSNSRDSYSDQVSLDYNWTFFNPTAYENGILVSHTYPQNGTYQISLRVTDRGGLSNWSNLTITVLDTSPTADFSYAPGSPVEGTPVLYSDNSTEAVDRIISYHWAFGDGGESILQNVSYTYQQNGIYPVILTITDADNSISTKQYMVGVSDTNPDVDFSMTPNPAVEGTEVDFQDESTPGHDDIVDRFWTFGDGGSAHGTQVHHTYAQNGTYQVILQVNDTDSSAVGTPQFINITDTNPTAEFDLDPVNPNEGQVILFTDESTSYDGIATWLWNFGDFGTSNLEDPTHTYQENGTYNVTLTVVEFDGSSGNYYRSVSVADTSPIIISLRTSDGMSAYAEDQTVTFEVLAVPGFDPFAVNHPYQWDLNFSDDFTSTPLDSLVNHTSHQFSESGMYRVSVRVWDQDSYREATSLQVLVIEVTNPHPIASFNFHNVSSGTIQFDASSSSDNPSDVERLLFSWNFDDGSGYSAWNTTRVFNHHFALDGEYSVKLRVKDDLNQINESTRSILIDRIAPEVVLSGESTNFLIGEAIQISVTVHDPNGILSVTLHYKIGNATEQTLAMTPSGTSAVYVAQISPQSHNCTIAYWVTATDVSSNVRTTGQLVITVSAVPVESGYLLLGLSLVLIVVAVLLLLMRNMMVPVDEVFIIYNDGRLMAHQTRRLKPGMDDEILSSMLVAIQGFVKDSFKDESSTHLQRLDFGEKKILVERGDSFYLAVVLHSHRPGNVPQRMQGVIDDIHREYGLALKEWDGDLEKVRGVKDQTERLFKSPIPLALPGLKKEKMPQQNECPVCGSAVPTMAERCPTCDSELSLSTTNDIEAVAKNLNEVKDEDR